jgi:predicted kinase
MRGQAAQSPGPARVVLMCGIAGAGKTTDAKELGPGLRAAVYRRGGLGALRRYGVDSDPPMYEKHSAEAEAALQQRLIDLIRAGRDVVVDYSFWERSTRDRYKRLVVAAGGRWDIVYLKVSPERLRERLAARRAGLDANAAFPITDALLERFMAGFQAPDGEGETVIDTGD